MTFKDRMAKDIPKKVNVQIYLKNCLIIYTLILVFDDHSYDYNISDDEIANIIGNYNRSSEMEQFFEYTEATKDEYAESIEYTTAEEFSQITEKMETFEDILCAGVGPNSTVAVELSEQLVSSAVETEVEQVITESMETKNSNVLKVHLH